MIPGHPHTVGASRVPLYLQGWQLGQDIVDPTMYDPSGDLVPTPDTILNLMPSIPAVSPMETSTYDPSTGLIAPGGDVSSMQPSLSPSQLTQLYQSAAAAGTMTPAQAASAIAQLSTGAAAVAKAATGVATAPSPRVALPAVAAAAPSALMSATIWPSSGVPNILLIVGALLGAKVVGDAISGGK
jgi:hypothetical protein